MIFILCDFIEKEKIIKKIDPQTSQPEDWRIFGRKCDFCLMSVGRLLFFSLSSSCATAVVGQQHRRIKGEGCEACQIKSKSYGGGPQTFPILLVWTMKYGADCMLHRKTL